jgi:hypothetical protein
MSLGKFPHPQPDMGIPAVSYCYHGDVSGESIPDGDLPIAILVHSGEVHNPGLSGASGVLDGETVGSVAI